MASASARYWRHPSHWSHISLSKIYGCATLVGLRSRTSLTSRWGHLKDNNLDTIHWYDSHIQNLLITPRWVPAASSRERDVCTLYIWWDDSFCPTFVLSDNFLEMGVRIHGLDLCKRLTSPVTLEPDLPLKKIWMHDTCCSARAGIHWHHSGTMGTLEGQQSWHHTLIWRPHSGLIYYT